MEMINANGKVGIDVIMKLCPRVLDGKGMLKDWETTGANLRGKRKCDKLWFIKSGKVVGA